MSHRAEKSLVKIGLLQRPKRVCEHDHENMEF